MKPAIGDCTGHPGFMSRIVRVETPCVKGGTHPCVVRSDDRDDMFRQVRAVEDFIRKAARARHRPDRTASPTGTPKSALGPEAEGDDHWLSLKQLADQLPAFSYRQIKWLMSNREQNGLTRYVRHAGRRLFIRESGFMEWINQQKDGA